MTWKYGKDKEDEIRTCEICHLTQIKTNNNEWALLLTKERIDKFFENLFLGIEENCFHSYEPDSK